MIEIKNALISMPCVYCVRKLVIYSNFVHPRGSIHGIVSEPPIIGATWSFIKLFSRHVSVKALDIPKITGLFYCPLWSWWLHHWILFQFITLITHIYMGWKLVWLENSVAHCTLLPWAHNVPTSSHVQMTHPCDMVPLPFLWENVGRRLHHIIVV